MYDMSTLSFSDVKTYKLLLSSVSKSSRPMNSDQTKALLREDNKIYITIFTCRNTGR